MELNQIYARYENEIVGVLSKNPTNRKIEFKYSDLFIDKGIELSPLMMPLRKEVYSFSHLRGKTYRGLPPLFSDSLPDDYGQRILNVYLASKQITNLQMNDLFLLSCIGNRGIGALSYFPSYHEANLNSIFDLDLITEALIQINRQYLNLSNSLSNNQANNLELLSKFGGSTGGSRPKLFVKIDKKKEGIYLENSNQSEIDDYILKICSKIDENDAEDYGLIEYVYYQMASDCGINMTESFLWEGKHFCTKRFDRDSQGNKFHIQTFNSFFGLDFRLKNELDYIDLFKALVRINLPHEDLTQFFKLMCFNVIAVNRDDHTKNFSLIMKEKNKWRLSNSYDLVFSYDMNDPYHHISVNHKFSNITKQDLIDIGERFFIKNPIEIIQKIIDIVSKFKEYANQLNFTDKKIITQIENVIFSQVIFKESR
jgi:serine/threonine-protein kinase HipA